MKTIDAAAPPASKLLIAVGVLVSVTSIGMLLDGLGSLQSIASEAELSAGGSGIAMSLLFFGVAAVINRLHSIDAHIKAYVLREMEQPTVVKENLTA